MASSFSVAILVTGSIGADVAAKAEVAVPMAVTVNASANTRLQIVFFFMVCYAPFLKYLWLCINLVCIISEEVSDFPRKSAGKVSQNCHKVGMPALFKAALT
jgi:hypothetical protein